MCNFGSKGEKGRGGNISIIFEEGETLKDRSTGRIFGVKKRTDPFVILQSLDGVTDKDGIVPALLSAEITARMGRDAGEIYRALTREFGEPLYDRMEAPATPEQKEALEKLSPEQVRFTGLAGEKTQAILTRAPGNGAPIGGLKVIAESGWFAARPSGTENIHKIYAETFRGADHLRRIREEAQTIVTDGFAAAPQRPGVASDTNWDEKL